MTTGEKNNGCRICGDSEPSHVHNGENRIDHYFTVGRGESDFDAARRWHQLFLESQEQGKRLLSQIIGLRSALVKIEEWSPETFPKVLSRGEIVPYAVAYGSDGERDYMRAIARKALKEVPHRGS